MPELRRARLDRVRVRASDEEPVMTEPSNLEDYGIELLNGEPVVKATPEVIAAFRREAVVGYENDLAIRDAMAANEKRALESARIRENEEKRQSVMKNAMLLRAQAERSKAERLHALLERWKKIGYDPKNPKTYDLRSLPRGKDCGKPIYHDGTSIPNIPDKQPISVWQAYEASVALEFPQWLPYGEWRPFRSPSGVDWSVPCVYRLRHVSRFPIAEILPPPTQSETLHLIASVNRVADVLCKILERLGE